MGPETRHSETDDSQFVVSTSAKDAGFCSCWCKNSGRALRSFQLFVAHAQTIGAQLTSTAVHWALTRLRVLGIPARCCEGCRG